MHSNSYNQMSNQRGLIAPEPYSTAWVALVPLADDLSQPAWPQALQYLRTHQLPDGGWGEPSVYFAHERTLSTLAALYAFATWAEAADKERLERGVTALHQYIQDLADEPHTPVGFELLLPILINRLETLGLSMPQFWPDKVKQAIAKKMRLVGKLEVDYDQMRTWWFSLELMPEGRLAQLDDRILDEHGSIALSTAATAGYLRALRLHGRDSLTASAYLEHVLSLSGGGVGVCWPIEVFELTWTLDSFMRAGFSPTNNRTILPLIKQLSEIYHTPPIGLSWSQSFPLNNSDDTATGYNVLCWAGLRPSQDILSQFWETNHFRTYLDESHASISANIHALSALRHNLSNSENKQMAVKTTNWLRNQMETHGQLNDKWHLSPLYATSHAVSALADWDNDLVQTCVDYILSKQHACGGWGHGSTANPEDTAHAVLGLITAWEAGLLKDSMPLKLASAYLQKTANTQPQERLWIGKTLYQPIGVAQAAIFAAQAGLAQQAAIHWSRSRTYSLPARQSPLIQQRKQQTISSINI